MPPELPSPTSSSTTVSASAPLPKSFTLTGKILRKKKISSNLLMVAIREELGVFSNEITIPQAEDNQRIHHLYLRRQNPPICSDSPNLNIIHMEAIVTFHGYVIRGEDPLKNSGKQTHETKKKPSEINGTDETADDNDDNNGDEKKTDNAIDIHMIQSCQLVKCAPDPKMIKDVLSIPNHLQHAKALGAEFDLEILLKENSTRVVVMNLIRRLRSDDGDDGGAADEDGSDVKLEQKRRKEVMKGKHVKAPRYRPARLKKRDLEILSSKEREGGKKIVVGDVQTISDNETENPPKWKMCQPCNTLPNLLFYDDDHNDDHNHIEYSNNQNHSAKRAHINNIINLPPGTENQTSAHGVLTRTQYLQRKKNNQTLWFVERIRQFSKLPSRILDVGGGGGTVDLAVDIAVNFPDVRVVVVDNNDSSMSGGEEYARRCGVADRIDFFCENFSDFVSRQGNGDGDSGSDGNCINTKEDIISSVDFVVALHACGDLSDMALHYALENNCNFIICPCCYVKRYLAPFVPFWYSLCDKEEIDTLGRIVELDDRPEESRRAMVVINSMRKSAFVDDRVAVRLEEFDNRISKRNIALVGHSIASSQDL
ncbi:hypothetical protein ACHAXS_003767 [Conticribra weissflogii]